MAPPSKKRKTTKASKKETSRDQPEQIETTEDTVIDTPVEDNAAATSAIATDDNITMPASAPAPTDDDPQPESAESSANNASKAQDRLARFKALQARAKSSAETNLKEASLESQRLATDPGQLKSLQRQNAIASHKLLKAEIEDEGGDFERKRAWDWTVDESEKWDKRVKKKEAARDNNAFQDFRDESNKVYKRQLRNMQPDMDRYEKEKMALIEKSAAAGGLDIVETEDGEVIAIDKDGSFYSTADSTSFTQNKPDKAAIDRLVQDLTRAEEQRIKKRKERMAKNGDDEDSMYINEKNKQFNQKLSRFYNKYTADIRDSFDRGTRI